jgi:hypothetical protein
MPIHDITQSLGLRKSEALADFHAFTGCDQMSFFCGKGKKSAFDTFSMFDNSIDAFKQMSTRLSHNAIIVLQPIIERLIVILYDRTCVFETVNATRKELFTQKGRKIDHIPPTSSALTEHS